MIEFLVPCIIAASIGIIFGSLATFVVLRRRQDAEASGLVLLNERLSGREQQLSETKAELETLRANEKALEKLQIEQREEISALRERIRNEEQRLKEFQAIQERFTESFKALSADALRSNNQSFLDLATQSLQKFQEGAKNDLDKRQTAIDTLVKPIQENLQKVDASINELEKIF